MSAAPEVSGSGGDGHSSSRWMIPLLALAAVILFGLVWMNQQENGFPPGREHPAVGTPLVALQVDPLLNAEEPVELADLRGKVTLIQYWGPWCPPCLMEFPHVVALQKELSSEAEFRLLSVSCEQGANPNLAELKRTSQAVMDQFQATWPVYTDSQQISRTALVQSAEMPQGFYFPTTVLLNRQGKIAAMWSGYYEGMEADVEQTVRDVLATK